MAFAAKSWRAKLADTAGQRTVLKQADGNDLFKELDYFHLTLQQFCNIFNSFNSFAFDPNLFFHTLKNQERLFCLHFVCSVEQCRGVSGSVCARISGNQSSECRNSAVKIE